MRRQPSRFSRASSVLLGAAVMLSTVVVVGGPGAAFAEDPTSPPADGGGGVATNVGPKTPGTQVCALTSTQLTAISGMAQTAQGLIVVEAKDELTVKLYSIAADCKASLMPALSNANPLDPEDLAVSQDGTIWVGDIGDKDLTRKGIIAIHKIAPGAKAAIPNRMVYPGETSHNATAFVLDGDGKPIIFAVDADKPGSVTLYKPNKDLVPDTRDNLPALEAKGTFAPVTTGTGDQAAGSTVTGAAKSADGKKVVVRTGTDAYEWAVPDGDVVKAITTTKASITPLPGEAAGQAITYGADGKLLTLGQKTAGVADNPKLLSYTPFVAPEEPPPGAGGDEPAPEQTESGQSWLQKLGYGELTRMVAAVGVVGLVLAVAGFIGIRRARKRRREEEDEYDDEYDDYDDRPRRGGPRSGPPGPGSGAAAGYGQQGQFDNQYGAAGYNDPAYGAPANGYDQYGAPVPQANGYAQQPDYGNGYDQYGQPQQPQYGAQEYGAQPGYDQYGQPQQDYGAQPGYDQYGQPQQDYGAQPGYDQYGQPQQQYGDYGAEQQQQYGPGYGYDEYDQDQRRR